MSGLILESMPAPVKMKYAVPFEVFEITDYRLKYLLIAAFSLKEPNITFLASANPSTFLKLMDVIKEDFESLLKFLATANPACLDDNPDFSDTIKKVRFQPDPARAGELADLASNLENLTYQNLWPRLRAVATWTSGSCGVLLPRLKPLLPDAARIIEMGYLASEFRGSLMMDAINNKCAISRRSRHLSRQDTGNRKPGH